MRPATATRICSRYYEVNWQIIPNLMMDLVVPVLERVMNVYLAGQVYTIVSFVLILSGTLALNRQLFGRWSVLPLIAAPVPLQQRVPGRHDELRVRDRPCAVGAGRLGLAARVRPLVRLAVSTLFVLALFFCHLFAVGLYGLGLLAFELNRLLRSCAGAARTCRCASF